MDPNQPPSPPIPDPPPAEPWRPPEHFESDRETPYQTDLPEPPLEDPYYQGSFFQALFGTFKGVIFNPTMFFAGLKEDRSAMTAIVLYLSVSGLKGVLDYFKSLYYAPQQMEMMQQFIEALNLDIDPTILEDAMHQASSMGPLVGLIMIPIQIVLGYAIGVTVFYISALIWGAFDRRFTTFLRMYSYASLVIVITLIPLFFIPILESIVLFSVAIAWYVFLGIGLKQVGGASTGRVVGALLTPFGICCLCVIGFVAIMAGLATVGMGAG